MQLRNALPEYEAQPVALTEYVVDIIESNFEFEQRVTDCKISNVFPNQTVV